MYAPLNETHQDEFYITKGVPWGENHQLYKFCKFNTTLQKCYVPIHC